MNGRSVFWPLLALVVSCQHHRIEPLDLLPWAFEARISRGEVWVMAPLAIHGPIRMSQNHLLGRALPRAQREVRERRTRDVAGLPNAIAQVLPGEVNARLGSDWTGQFRHHPDLPSHSSRLADAVLHRRPDLHAVLEDYAEAVGQWVLLTWVTDLDADPLVRHALPGEVVDTVSGSVVVDLDDDPHLVSVKLGMALLAPEGEVVLRYEDRFEAVITGEFGRDRAARQLAEALAQEIALVWMTESRLAGGSQSVTASR